MERENIFSKKMSTKSDSELIVISKDSDTYAEKARLAALWELEKRQINDSNNIFPGDLSIEKSTSEETKAKDDSVPIIIPSVIKISSYLLFSTIGIGLIMMLLVEELTDMETVSDPATFIITILLLGFNAFFAFHIGQGKNWAKTFFTILFIIALFNVPNSIFNAFSISPILGVIGILQELIQLLAVTFLFTFKANQYYKQRKIQVLKNEN